MGAFGVDSSHGEGAGDRLDPEGTGDRLDPEGAGDHHLNPGADVKQTWQVRQVVLSARSWL